MIADELDVSKDTVQKIFVEDKKKKKKFCMRFVPHTSTAELEEDRFAARKDLIEMADS
jgi:orotate phosphoribosyltransferase-like protein